jgi:hypothetical protein
MSERVREGRREGGMKEGEWECKREEVREGGW